MWTKFTNYIKQLEYKTLLTHHNSYFYIYFKIYKFIVYMLNQVVFLLHSGRIYRPDPCR